MASTTRSAQFYEISGDIDAGRGQLGQTVFIAPGAAITQSGSFNKIYNKYIVTPTLAINFTLATIGTSAANVQPGYDMTIVNPSTFDITLVGASATCRAGGTIRLVAQTAPATWRIMSQVGSTTGVYAASGAPVVKPTDVAGSIYVDSATGTAYTFSAGAWNAIAGGGTVTGVIAGAGLSTDGAVPQPTLTNASEGFYMDGRSFLVSATHPNTDVNTHVFSTIQAAFTALETLAGTGHFSIYVSPGDYNEGPTLTVNQYELSLIALGTVTLTGDLTMDCQGAGSVTVTSEGGTFYGTSFFHSGNTTNQPITRLEHVHMSNKIIDSSGSGGAYFYLEDCTVPHFHCYFLEEALVSSFCTLSDLVVDARVNRISDCTFGSQTITINGWQNASSGLRNCQFQGGASVFNGPGQLQLDNASYYSFLEQGWTCATSFLWIDRLPPSGVTAGSYTNASLTVDATGIITAANNGTAPVTSIGVTAPITSTGGATPTIGHATSGVAAATYTNSTVTVNATGHITAASSGAAPAISIGAPSTTSTANGADLTAGVLTLHHGGGTNPGIGHIQNYRHNNNCAAGYNAYPGYGTATAGSSCSAYGYQTFGGISAALNSPSLCTAMGYRAMGSVTTATGTTAVGGVALTAITGGSNTTGVGYGAGNVATGSSCTFVGALAGAAFTGNSNLAFGVSALSTATTGTGNIGIGNSCSLAAIGNSSCLVIGNSTAGNGSNTTTIGTAYVRAAVTTNVLGYNTATGEVTSMASGVTAVGAYSTTGTANGASIAGTAITMRAGSSSTPGMGNIQTHAGSNCAVGNNCFAQYNAGSVGANITAMGQSGYGAAGLVTNSANNNTSIGANSMNQVSNSNETTCVGYYSGNALTTGGFGTYVGSQSGRQITTTANNSAFGYQTLYTGAGAANCTAIGTFSGNVTTGSGNTFVGYQSGVAVSSGTNNCSLGQNANSNGTTGSSNICIGSATTLAAVGDSTELVIGASTAGNGSNTTTIGASYVRAVAGGNALSQNSGTGEVTRAVSSLRYKTVIDQAPPVAQFAHYMFQLQPRGVTMNNDPEKTPRITYIAEEVEKITGPKGNPVFAPLLVYADLPDPALPPTQVTETYKVFNEETKELEEHTRVVEAPTKRRMVDGINYQGFVVPLIELCKQQQQQIDALIARLDAAGIP